MDDYFFNGKNAPSQNMRDGPEWRDAIPALWTKVGKNESQNSIDSQHSPTCPLLHSQHYAPSSKWASVTVLRV